MKLIVERPLDCTLRNVRATDVVMAAAPATARGSCSHRRRGLRQVQRAPAAEHDDRIVGSPAVSRWSYATTKAFGRSSLTSTREHGARMTVARLFNAVGPRQASAYGMVLPVGAPGARRRRSDVYGDGSQSRCFTHVRDTVDALVDLIDTDAAIGNVYNVGSSDQTTILDLAARPRAHGVQLEDPPGPLRGGLFRWLRGAREPPAGLLGDRALIGWRPRRSVDDAIDDVIAAGAAATRVRVPA